LCPNVSSLSPAFRPAEWAGDPALQVSPSCLPAGSTGIPTVTGCCSPGLWDRGRWDPSNEVTQERGNGGVASVCGCPREENLGGWAFVGLREEAGV
jgi:hypothetical protein